MFQKAIRVLMVIFVCGLLMGTSGCDNNSPQQSMSGAVQVKSISKIPKNSRGLTTEQQNIEDRIRVTTDPTKILWVHLIALDGNIIKRMPVRNKVTSSGKRLEPKHAAPGQNYYPATGNGHYTNEFIQPDGTYGDSDSYIFWFDPMGRYHQWGTAGGLGYLVTDYPIDLENPMDKITGLYRVQKEALEWQKSQEEQLRKKDSPSVPTAPPKPASKVNP
ncbi:MAG: hypothetical protein ABII74_07505 [Elusimicrobiota bacterium]